MGNDISKISKEIANEMNYVKKWIATRTAMKMRNKLIDVYDAIIDDFYAEPANSYIRHDVSKAQSRAGVGVNLYRAIQESKNQVSKLQPAPHTVDGGISLNANDMSGYNYEYNTKEEVLDYILDGIRFPALFTANGGTTRMLMFMSNYSDSECSASGTPLEVLSSIRDQLSDKYAKEAREEAKRELKLKYIEIE